MNTDQPNGIEETTVVIIVAGVSGLTLATFLQKSGIACLVLERRDRAYIQMRHRAGVVDARAVRMFERWGLADQLLSGPVAQTIDYRLNGAGRIFDATADDGLQSRFCTQQMLVNNLLHEFIDGMAGDVRFEVTDVTIQNEENQRPQVSYSDVNGSHQLICGYVVGCDADRGVSRSSIPPGVLTKYSYEYGYAWLAVLVEAPLTGQAIMAVSDHGFVAQVHRMDDWFAVVYIKPMTVETAARPAYDSSRPHRHDFYCCVLLDKGNLELEVDFETVQLTNQSLFLSYPGQIHRIVSNQMERGWFLAFDPAVLDEPLKTILDQCLSEIILVPLSPEQSTDFFAFMQHVYGVYEDQAQLFRQPVVQSLVMALVYQLASAYLSREKFTLIKHSTRNIEITKTFKQLLRRNIRSMKRPSEFATQMNMTLSHLNDTVRSVTGWSVTYSIQQELMREARRLLYHTDLTVKEIADALGFADVPCFNRLFRKVTGVSPGAFRKQNETSVHV